MCLGINAILKYSESCILFALNFWKMFVNAKKKVRRVENEQPLICEIATDKNFRVKIRSKWKIYFVLD